MTNKEKYGNDIIELAIDEGVLALKNGEPALCAKIKCEDSCNCKHNNNSRDNEPCCRCDSITANINKVKVNSLEIIARMLDNKPYYELKYRQVGKKDYSIGYSSYDLKIVLGYIDEYFEIVESNKRTNADRIRNMSDEELAELITGSLNFDCADYCDSFTQGCAFNCNKKEREIALKWLQSEAE